MARPKPTPAVKALRTASKRVMTVTPEHRQRMRENAEKARDAVAERMLGTELTDQQRKFIINYSYSFDKNKAYLAAYPDSNKLSAYASSTALLKIPLIKKLIDEIDERRAKDLEVTGDMIVRELKKMAFANFDDFLTRSEEGEYKIDFSNCTRDQLAGLGELVATRRVIKGRGEDSEDEEEITYKIKLNDKRGALELLGKHKKLFLDRPDTLGPDGKPITPPDLVVEFVDPPKKEEEK